MHVANSVYPCGTLQSSVKITFLLLEYVNSPVPCVILR